MNSGAYFSADRMYRYTLWRDWDVATNGVLVFVGLNPSTADETEDDPTVRRCIRYAENWGYGGMQMLNIFAFRATDPRNMKAHHAPVGPDNDRVLKMWADRADCIVACWGAHGDHQLRGRQVQLMLKETCRSRLRVFGLTKEGHPKHPLYLPKTQRLEHW